MNKQLFFLLTLLCNATIYTSTPATPPPTALSLSATSSTSHAPQEQATASPKLSHKLTWVESPDSYKGNKICKLILTDVMTGSQLIRKIGRFGPGNKWVISQSTHNAQGQPLEKDDFQALLRLSKALSSLDVHRAGRLLDVTSEGEITLTDNK